ncbi:MAG: DUF2232 domain-containing protein [Eubacteriales bacterium]|nr:DUF2232 domain-containing protein [Eubacteriales bacterium]
MESNTQNKENGSSGTIWIIAASALTILAAYFPAVVIVLPAVWVYSSMPNRGWLIAAFAALLGVSSYIMFGNTTYALLTVALIAPAGIVLFLSHKFKVQNFYCVFYTAIALMVGLFAILCLPSVLDGNAPATMLKEVMTQTQSSYASYFDANYLEYFTQAIAALDDLYLAVLFIMGAAAALVNGLLVHLFDRKSHQRELSPLPPFARWSIPKSYVFGLAALVAVGLFFSLSGSRSTDLLWLLIAMIWILPTAFSGWAISYSLCMGNRRTFIIATIVLIVLFPYSLYGLAFLGSFAAFLRLKTQPK